MDTPEIHALVRLRELERLWGRAGLGLALSHAFRSDIPFSTEQLVDLTDLSKATIQNHLKRLINVKRAERLDTGRTVGYRATPVWADRTRVMLRELVNKT